MNITLKEIPADIHQKLKKQAHISGRSLNKEVLFILKERLSPQKIKKDILRERINERRNKMPFIVKQEELEQYIKAGRA